MTIADLAPFFFLPVIFLAIFTQSLTGFGAGLVSMALLPPLIGIRAAAPLVALTAGTLEFVMLIRYRSAVNVRSMWRLVIAAIVGIPLGVLALRNVDEKIVLTALGIVLTGYPVYVLRNQPLPELKGSIWAYTFGFVAGLLGGAYNTSGPPVIIYGDSHRWAPSEFKANLQGFFLLNDVLVITAHALSGNLTPPVWQDYLMALPAIALGMFGGFTLDRFLHPATFRKIVLMLLMVLGVRMILASISV